MYDDTTTHPNTNSLIVANQAKPSENLLGMCVYAWRNTPEWLIKNHPRFGDVRLRPPLPKEFNERPPKDRLIFDDPLNSKMFLATANSLDAYLSFGFDNIHATEASRYADGHDLFRALYPTLSSEPHSALYIESTPNGQEGRGRWFYEQCMDAHSRKNTEYGEMKLVFIPWHEMTYSFAIPFPDDAKRRAFKASLKPPEVDLLRRFPKIELEQLAWRRMLLAGPTFNRDEDMFDQEYPTDLETAFLVTGESVFRRADIKRLVKDKRDPEWEGDIYWGESDEANEGMPLQEIVGRPKFLTMGQARSEGRRSHVNERTYRNLKVYRWPQSGERCIIACDVGGGDPDTKDGDFSIIHVGVLNELAQDELIMTWSGHLNPLAFAEVACALAHAIWIRVGTEVKAPTLAPEYTGPGKAMCQFIEKMGLYPRVYMYQNLGVKGMPRSKHLGWESNQNTLPFAINAMTRMVEQGGIDIPDGDVILQMASYKKVDPYGDDSSYGGAAGRHDDHCAALRILCALLRLESTRIPGEADVQEVDEFGDEDGNDVPWSPFEDVLPGIMGRDLDEESDDYHESLYYAR